MNKFLRYSFVALLAMIGLNISAQEVTLDFTLETEEGSKESVWGFPSGSANKLVDEQSFTYGGYTVKVAGSTGQGYYWHNKDHYLLYGKQGAYLTLPAFNFDVERIDVEGNPSASTGVKQNIFVGDEAVSTETVGAQGTNIFTIAEGKQAAGTIYTIKVNSNHNNQIRTIKIWKKGSGAKQSADIAWSKASATVTIGADDNVFPTLSNPNNLTVSYASTKEEVATINANGQVTLVAAGTTKISAIFEGNDSYEASTVSYNLTVKEAETPSETTTVANVAALNALENNTTFTYTGDVLVVYVNGSYAYIKDDTGSSLIYDNGKTKLANLGIGTKVAANWTGKVSVYNNLFEAVPDNVLATNGASAIQVTYPDAAITEVVPANMNQVVVLKGVAYTAPEGKNFTITEGGVEVKGYNTFGIEIAAPEEGKNYNITGVISVYKENAQFLPIAIEEATAASTDTWTVAGTKPLVDNSWDPSDTNADMTSTDGVTYTYVKEDITLEAGVSNEFKIVKNHSWDEAYPSQNYTFSVDETAKYKVTITFNATSKEITVDKVKTGEAEVVTHTYSVVGTLVGSWEVDQDMTKGDDGLYRVEIRDVEKGDYEYKVRADHDWSVSYPASGNYQLSIEQTSTVTITFNEETKEVLETVTPATGINTLNAAKAENGAIYNVAGQKVNAGYKGLIIMNGKKFVNK